MLPVADPLSDGRLALGREVAQPAEAVLIPLLQRQRRLQPQGHKLRALDERIDVSALPAVRTVEPERHERGTRTGSGLQRSGDIGAVVGEDVAGHVETVTLPEPDELAGQVVVEGAVHVLERDRHPALERVLVRGAHGVVD